MLAQSATAQYPAESARCQLVSAASPAPCTGTAFGLSSTISTTRRFIERPAGVALVAIGCVLP